MSYCCSQCNFTAQFESALIMHRQLHHESDQYPDVEPTNDIMDKSNTLPRTLDETYNRRTNSFKGMKFAARTSSATRIFDKLRARICRSRILFPHPEESGSNNINDLSVPSDCTSKALKSDSTVSRLTTTLKEIQKETYACHLCSFEADRITVLDRHLLNHHKLSLDNLLKLVMAKTKDGLSEESPMSDSFLKLPYYKYDEDIDSEFTVETVAPTVKILRNAATNTEIQWMDIPDLKNNCRMIYTELEKLANFPMENKDELMSKMQTLNECMCKFVDSSNTLKRVLTNEFDCGVKNRTLNDELFDLSLGDQEIPRDWERPHSEKVARAKNKYGRKFRSDKKKLSSESFYF